MKFNVDTGTHIKSKQKTNKMMLHVLIALLPIIVFAFYKNGIIVYQNNKTDLLGMFYPLIFIITSVLTSVISEYIYTRIFLKDKETLWENINTHFSVFPGLFLSLILPLNTPIPILIFGSLFGTIVGKMLFGGFGNNIFNPALLGRLFIIASYAAIITSNGGYLNSYEVDTISSSTPLSNLNALGTVGTYDTVVKPFGTLTDFFTGFIPGTLGEVSSLLCIVAFVYLTFMKVIKWKIPVTYIATVFIMSFAIGSFNNLGIWYSLFHILSGGLLFGAVFMATDPVTSPTTDIGQILYGFFLGIFTIVIRHLTPYPEGVLISILTMNIFVFILDKIGLKAKFNFNKSIKAFIIIWILILMIPFVIGYKYKNLKEVKNFEIIEKENDGSKTTYKVSQKGYAGKIKATVVINGNKIESIIIDEHNESFYNLIESNDYISKLKQAGSNVSKVETVSGATVTSSALKEMIENVILDYEKSGTKLSSKKIVKEEKTKIIEKEIIGEIGTYVISSRGFAGPIEARVVINSGSITSFIVMKQNESYYGKVEEESYSSSILGDKNQINNLDTVSGATVTSKTLKEIALKALEDYESR